jgi:hypothetical protein
MEILSWEERPFVTLKQMGTYQAKDKETARRYGRLVKSAEIANIDYKVRYGKYSASRAMQPPPSCGRIFLGNIVVRKLGTPEQYETWMPGDTFDELYEEVAER